MAEGPAGVRSPWLRTGAVHLWNWDTPGHQLRRCEVSPSCLCTRCKTAHSPAHTHARTVQITFTWAHLGARGETGERDSVAVQKTENMACLRLAGEQMSVASLHTILTSAIQSGSFCQGPRSFPRLLCCFGGAKSKRALLPSGSELGLPHQSKSAWVPSSVLPVQKKMRTLG